MSKWVLLTEQQQIEVTQYIVAYWRELLSDDEKSRMRGILEQLGTMPDVLVDKPINVAQFHARFRCVKCDMIDSEVSTRAGKPKCPLHMPLDPQEVLFNEMKQAVQVAARVVDAAEDLLPEGIVDPDDMKFVKDTAKKARA